MPDSSSPMVKGKWQHAPDALVAFFKRAMEVLPGAETRTMFGYPCAFIHGNMFTGLHQDRMILRLSEADRTAFHALEGGGVFEAMPGRPMREYSIVPPALLQDLPGLDPWLVKSFNYAKGLPPKEEKRAKRRVK